MLRRLFWIACTCLASFALVLCAVVCVAWIFNFRLSHGRFVIHHAWSISVRFDRAGFAIGYERPAGQSMVDPQGELIDDRVREGLETGTLPQWTNFNWRGFSYQHGWQGRALPWTSDGVGGTRPMTSDELQLLNPAELTTRVEDFVLGVPTWLLIVFLGIPSTLYFTGPRRRQKLLLHRCRNNLCLLCGYDLRATNQRCPECGAAVGI